MHYLKQLCDIIMFFASNSLRLIPCVKYKGSRPIKLPVEDINALYTVLGANVRKIYLFYYIQFYKEFTRRIEMKSFCIQYK